LVKIILVRHGTTDWVDTQLLHGITDVPLNTKGRHQAQETALALKECGANIIFSSSLSRCMETAQIIGTAIGVDPNPIDALVEIDFGWLEGKRIRDHDLGEYNKLVEFFDHHIFNIVRLMSGESRRIFSNRVLKGWQTILTENPKGPIIIIGHSGVFNTILMHLFGKTHLNGNPYHHLNPCSITEIHMDQTGTATMVRINDCSHLSRKNL